MRMCTPIVIGPTLPVLLLVYQECSKGQTNAYWSQPNSFVILYTRLSMCLIKSNLINKKRGHLESKFIYLIDYPLATISWMASLTVSSSDLTVNFIATSFGPSSPKDNRTSTFIFPMNTPDNKHVCDLELGGTTSVPCTTHNVGKDITIHNSE